MKVALAQLNYHTGNFAANYAKMLSAIEEAKGKADLIVFAELAICGYPPRDFLEFTDFVDQCEVNIHRLATYCEGITAIVGGPERNQSGKGKPLYNAAYVLANGRVQQVVRKSLLPTYDIFDEYRYFEPGLDSNSIVEVNGQKIALTICEDLWNVDDTPLYQHNPMDALMEYKPDFMVNIAASPFSQTQWQERRSILQKNVERYQIPLVYVNHVGAQTELIFDGDSQVWWPGNPQPHLVKSFEEKLEIVDLQQQEDQPYTTQTPIAIEAIHQALVLGIRDYFGKLGLKKATLGLSGGIDSAVVAVLAAEALGPENVLPVLLPSQYTADASNTEAVQLAKNLGCAYESIPIENVYQAFSESLSPIMGHLPQDVTEENLQSRSRGVLLMAISNKLGYILLNTTNKSEMAVGYGTLYGDLCGGLSVIGDLYKTEVYALARHMNREKEIIPSFIIERPPSAELKEDQADTDSLPAYEILDPVLRMYIEGRKSPKSIIAAGNDEKMVNRVLKMVNQNEWKRHQTAPILRVSPKAFGMGRRMPIVAKYLG